MTESQKLELQVLHKGSQDTGAGIHLATVMIMILSCRCCVKEESRSLPRHENIE